MARLNAEEYQTFESIKQADDSGKEFWNARELASVLEYAEWRNFAKVIDRAMLACKNSGYAVSDHFIDSIKMVEMPSKPRKNEKIGFVEANKTKTKSIAASPRNCLTSVPHQTLPQPKINNIVQYLKSRL